MENPICTRLNNLNVALTDLIVPDYYEVITIAIIDNDIHFG